MGSLSHPVKFIPGGRLGKLIHPSIIGILGNNVGRTGQKGLFSSHMCLVEFRFGMVGPY